MTMIGIRNISPCIILSITGVYVIGAGVNLILNKNVQMSLITVNYSAFKTVLPELYQILVGTLV